MKGAGSRTYYVPGVGFPAEPARPESAPVVAFGTSLRSDPQQVGPDPQQIGSEVGSDPQQVGPDPQQVGSDPQQVGSKQRPSPPSLVLPTGLAERIRAAGARPRQDKIRALILELCAWRPLAAREIADVLGGRDQVQLVRAHLGPMVAAGDLTYSVPEMPNHPDQKYLVPPKSEPGEGEKG